ncbi:sugar kinase [bacterium]|nr:sugar kinase [bacterium]
MSNIPDITAVGSMALDTVTTRFGTHKDCLGGSVVYFSMSASFQAKVGLIGVVGDDFPKEHTELLTAHGIDLEGLEVIKGAKTFRWTGSYLNDVNAADTHCTMLNVFATFEPKIPENYKKAETLFLANILPSLQLKVMEEIGPSCYKVCDTMNFYINSARDELEKVFEKADVIFMNDGEARMFTDCPNLITAGRKVMERFSPEYLLLKKGEHGSLIFGRNGFIKAVPAFPTEKVVDPTGAGDSFAGGVLGFIARNGRLNDDNVTEAVRYGTAMGSFLVTAFSIDAFRDLTLAKIEERVEALRFLSK